jgi:hypothetical protein
MGKVIGYLPEAGFAFFATEGFLLIFFWDMMIYVYLKLSL